MAGGIQDRTIPQAEICRIRRRRIRRRRRRRRFIVVVSVVVAGVVGGVIVAGVVILLLVRLLLVGVAVDDGVGEIEYLTLSHWPGCAWTSRPCAFPFFAMVVPS